MNKTCKNGKVPEGKNGRCVNKKTEKLKKNDLVKYPKIKVMEETKMQEIKPRGVEAKIQKILEKNDIRQDLMKERKIMEKKIKKRKSDVGAVNPYEIKDIIDNYRETFDMNESISIENNMFKNVDDEIIFIIFKNFRSKYSKLHGSAFWSYTYKDHYAPLYKKTTGTKAPPLSNNIPIEFKRGLLDNYCKRMIIIGKTTDSILEIFDLAIKENETHPLK